jgi:hypothetical protein
MECHVFPWLLQAIFSFFEKNTEIAYFKGFEAKNCGGDMQLRACYIYTPRHIQVI